MRLCITAQLTVFCKVSDGDKADELCVNIENGISRMYEEGLLTGDVEDAECLTFEVSVSSVFTPLLPAAEHLEEIWDDLKALGHGFIPDPETAGEKLICRAYEQGLVDDNGMYDPSEGARQYAQQILEQGL